RGVTPRATPSTTTAAPSGRELRSACSSTGGAAIGGWFVRCRAYTMPATAATDTATPATIPPNSFFETTDRGGVATATTAAPSTPKLANGSMSLSGRIGTTFGDLPSALESAESFRVDCAAFVIL